MASLKQLEANPKNALRSTGPKTPKGKRKARWNAVKHGLLSRELVIPGESARQFHQMLAQARQDLKPVGFVEEMLVEKIAVCYWRMRRAVRYEARDSRSNPWGVVMNRLLAVQMAKFAEGQKMLPAGAAQLVAQAPAAPPEQRPDSARKQEEKPALPSDDETRHILRYENGIERQMYRALAELEHRQRRRKGERVPAPASVLLG